MHARAPTCLICIHTLPTAYTDTENIYTGDWPTSTLQNMEADVMCECRLSISYVMSYPRSPAAVAPLNASTSRSGASHAQEHHSQLSALPSSRRPSEHHSTPLRVSFAKEHCPFALQQAGLVQHAPCFLGACSSIPTFQHASMFSGQERTLLRCSRKKTIKSVGLARTMIVRLARHQRVWTSMLSTASAPPVAINGRVG